MTEWRSVPGWVGYYEASDSGQIRSIDASHICRRREEIHRSSASTDARRRAPESGIAAVPPEARLDYVYHLVLEAFVGPKPSPEMLTRHINGDCSDDRLENIRWGTAGENNLDMVEHGTHFQSSKVTCKRGHELRAPNLRASVAALGHRGCLACARAQYAHRRYPDVDIEMLYAEKYAAIMAQSA